MQNYSFKTELFPLEFHLLFGDYDADFVDEYLTDNRIETRPEHDVSKHLAYQCWLGYGDCLIWCERTPNNPKEIGIFVHELIHAILDAGRVLGFNPGPDGEEFFAYLAGWLTEKTLDALWKDQAEGKVAT